MKFFEILFRNRYRRLAGRRVSIFMRCLLCADYVADRFGHLTSNIQGPCRAVAEVTGISRKDFLICCSELFARKFCERNSWGGSMNDVNNLALRLRRCSSNLFLSSLLCTELSRQTLSTRNTRNFWILYLNKPTYLLRVSTKYVGLFSNI